MIVDGDVTRLHVRPSDLVLLLNHDRGETTSGMSENVSDVIVAKHRRRTIVAANRVIPSVTHVRWGARSQSLACGMEQASNKLRVGIRM